jgi:hypothetical protein
MNNHNQIDRIEEALRSLFLSGETNDPIHLESVLSNTDSIDMSLEKKKNLLDRLGEVLHNASLGQVISKAAKDIQHETLSHQTGLLVSMIEDLKNDAIYPNNIPIILFRRLLGFLNIPYLVADRAIRKTFYVLQSQSTTPFTSKISPSFKRVNSARSVDTRSMSKADGRELFQNEEALNRYLHRLSELMNA